MMKNKIVFTYRLIMLVYYLLALLIAVKNVDHLERALIYALILIVLFGITIHIYILNIPKLLLSNKYIEKNLSTLKEAIEKIHYTLVHDNLIRIYIFVLEVSNHKEEYQNFIEQNSEMIFNEKHSNYWYTIKLQYYFNLNKKDEYLKLYNPQLDNEIFKIMYLILNEKYEEALELSRVDDYPKNTGDIMYLYYRIICLEHLEKENELNDCVNEMIELNDQIHYVKEIKDKYKK